METQFQPLDNTLEANRWRVKTGYGSEGYDEALDKIDNRSVMFTKDPRKIWKNLKLPSGNGVD